VLGATGKKLAAENRAEADEFAEGLREVIGELRDGGAKTIASLRDALNAGGVETARGGRWHAATVHRLLVRLAG
jgi:hypothetical protein